MIRPSLIALALLIPHAAHASYVASCDLFGVVTTTPVMAMAEGTNTPRPSFTFQVTTSTEPVGTDRNDVDCGSFANEEIIVTLQDGAHMPVQGDRLTLNLYIEDGRRAPQTRTFTLIPAQL